MQSPDQSPAIPDRPMQQRPPGIAPALNAVYEDGVHAAYLAVPPDVRDLLAEPSAKAPSHYVGQKRAGAGDLLAQVPGEDYRLALRHILDSLIGLHGLKIYWGTTACSLRVAVPGRGLLSVGWIFPPEIPRWMGLTDLTLGWYDDGQAAAGPRDLDEGLNSPGSFQAVTCHVPIRSFLLGPEGPAGAPPGQRLRPGGYMAANRSADKPRSAQFKVSTLSGEPRSRVASLVCDAGPA